MTRRDHAVLMTLATAGALLALFQNWYISLPLEDASRIDLCRLTPAVNCFTSLYAHGPDLLAFGLPVFPALLAVFLFQTALCGFAWVAAAPRADAWLALARLVSFPASGLALFVLLNDMMVAKATSGSAVLVAGICVTISALTVVQGVGRPRLRNAGGAAAGLLLAAFLAGFFVHGAGAARRAHDEFLREQDAAMPSVTWPRFAHEIPRTSAATLGDPRAPREIVLIVDPSQPASRALMKEAAALAPQFAGRVLVTIYAAGEAGIDLVLAQRAGTLAAYLRDPKRQPGDREAARAIVERQVEGWNVHRAPTALTRDRKWDGEFRLANVLR